MPHNTRSTIFPLHNCPNLTRAIWQGDKLVRRWSYSIQICPDLRLVPRWGHVQIATHNHVRVLNQLSLTKTMCARTSNAIPKPYQRDSETLTDIFLITHILRKISFFNLTLSGTFWWEYLEKKTKTRNKIMTMSWSEIFTDISLITCILVWIFWETLQGTQNMLWIDLRQS